MNERGCDILNHSAEELLELGPEYFQRFFIPEECESFFSKYLEMHQQQDPTQVFNFVHRVKTMRDGSYNWYFASAKLLYEQGQPVSDKMLVIVNEVNSLGKVSRKINEVLDETDWMKANFSKFCRLTAREKEILALVAQGMSSIDISIKLQLSVLTVNTHRRNIGDKLDVKLFSGLHRFAVTYGLV